MKVAFIVGPYAADTQQNVIRNIERARAVAEELWQAGFAVICPHTNSALFDESEHRQNYLAGYLEILKRAADFVVCVDGVPACDWLRC